MTTSPEPYGNLWQYLRDVAIGLAFILGGFFLAGLIADPIRGFTDLAYPIGLCIGLAPFWWFTRRCRIHSYDWYDYAALSFFSLLARLLYSAREGRNMQWLAISVVAIAFGSYLDGWVWLRRKLAHQSDEESRPTD